MYLCLLFAFWAFNYAVPFSRISCSIYKHLLQARFAEDMQTRQHTWTAELLTILRVEKNINLTLSGTNVIHNTKRSYVFRGYKLCTVTQYHRGFIYGLFNTVNNSDHNEKKSLLGVYHIL